MGNLMMEEVLVKKPAGQTNVMVWRPDLAGSNAATKLGWPVGWICDSDEVTMRSLLSCGSSSVARKAVMMTCPWTESRS